eukprot:s3868_g2.t1
MQVEKGEAGANMSQTQAAVGSEAALSALIAAILLDTGGDLDQTWSVFVKDFDLSKVNVKEQIRTAMAVAEDGELRWRRLALLKRKEYSPDFEAEKKELIESRVASATFPGTATTATTARAVPATTATEPLAAPVFGLLAKGEARRNLMEYCKRHQLKMKFEGSQEGDVFKSRVIVDGKKYKEAREAPPPQEPPQEPVPPVEGEATNAPESIQAGYHRIVPVGSRPKGVARKELQKYCNSVVQKFRFKELEVIQMDNSKMFQMQVVLGDRIFPKGLATTKPAAQDHWPPLPRWATWMAIFAGGQDMAAEMALLELRGLAELSNHDAVAGDQGAPPPAPLPAALPPPPPAEAQVPTALAERPKGIDRQEPFLGAS